MFRCTGPRRPLMAVSMARSRASGTSRADRSIRLILVMGSKRRAGSGKRWIPENSIIAFRPNCDVGALPVMARSGMESA